MRGTKLRGSRRAKEMAKESAGTRTSVRLTRLRAKITGAPPIMSGLDHRERAVEPLPMDPQPLTTMAIRRLLPVGDPQRLSLFKVVGRIARERAMARQVGRRRNGASAAAAARAPRGVVDHGGATMAAIEVDTKDTKVEVKDHDRNSSKVEARKTKGGGSVNANVNVDVKDDDGWSEDEGNEKVDCSLARR
ncbi:hypothetical protein DCS_00294 [Drechmeria coniospora]|uniref:Uncharacterized protein n=1 Tax=Drechmeria coniospora TaxID=98403 RepID=A0A151GPX1_DRECN|nr:hypothetical protein DCS_00294 [Drechmeria coniospora]KYK59164.1 hypothetical protein DCS_00294 [Drechmeria coniospora]ODA77914.1 hypothetical protein RJ55_06517 [Drechmeria coniospora]